MKKLSFKHRNYVLIGVSLVVFYLLFSESVFETLRVFNEYSKNEKIILESNSVQSELKELESQKNSLAANSNFKVRNKNMQENNEETVVLVAEFCNSHKILLRKVPATFEKEENQFTVQIKSYIVEGDYKSLLQLVNHLELNLKKSKLVSLNFFVEQDLRTSRRTLLCECVIRKVFKNVE